MDNEKDAGSEIKRVRPARKRPARKPAQPKAQEEAVASKTQARNVGDAEIKKNDVNLTRIEPVDPQLERLANILTRKSHDLQSTTILQRHMNVVPGNEKNAVRFMSYAKELMIIVKERHLLKFANHVYITDKADEIEYLSKHPSKGTLFWEKEFPKEVVEKLRKDNEMLSRESELIEPEQIY
jgi:hypothetical protein